MSKKEFFQLLVKRNTYSSLYANEVVDEQLLKKLEFRHVYDIRDGHGVASKIFGPKIQGITSPFFILDGKIFPSPSV
jgi:hypothetical protein